MNYKLVFFGMMLLSALLTSQLLAKNADVSILIEGPTTINTQQKSEFSLRVLFRNIGSKIFYIESGCPAYHGLVLEPSDMFHGQVFACEGAGGAAQKRLIPVKKELAIDWKVFVSKRALPGKYPIRLKYIGMPEMESNMLFIKIKKED